jgi:hypothetical protein
MTSICLWLAGLVIVINFQVLHTRTNLVLHIWNLLRREKVYSRSDLLQVTFGGPAWAELFTCAICSSQYVGFALGSLAAILHPETETLLPVLVGVFSWAGCAALLTGARSAALKNLPQPADATLPVAAGPKPALPAASTPPAATNPKVLFTPSEKAVSVIREILDKMRSTGKVSQVHPLFLTLQMELNSPKHEVTREVVRAFKEESEQLDTEGCTSCDKGSLLRKYLAVLHDVMTAHALLPSA